MVLRTEVGRGHFAHSRTCSVCNRSGGYCYVGWRPPRRCIGQRPDGTLYLYDTPPVPQIMWQTPIVRKYDIGIFCRRCLRRRLRAARRFRRALDRALGGVRVFSDL